MSTNNEIEPVVPADEAVEGELASEQLDEVVGGSFNGHMNFDSQPNTPDTIEVTNFGTGADISGGSSTRRSG